MRRPWPAGRRGVDARAPLGQPLGVSGAATDEAIEAALLALLTAVRAVYDAPDADADADQALFDARRPLMYGDVARVETRMLALVRDPRWQARAAVAEVFRFLVGPSEQPGARRPIPGALERACVLVAMAQDERDPRVRVALVSAFVELKLDVGEALSAALACRFARDPDPALRSAVVGALLGNRLPEAIETLIEASEDSDGDVRDWACFGLGHLLDGLDTSGIRAALAARLDDPHGEAREEAATGLALRDDPRGVAAMEALLARFEEEGVTERVLMTARERPSARYVAGLEAIVEACPELDAARDALAACREARPRPSCGAPRHVGCTCLRGLPGLG